VQSTAVDSVKGGFDAGREEEGDEQGGDEEPHHAGEMFATEEVDGVADGLHRDADDGDTPRDEAALKPEARGAGREDSQQKETKADPGNKGTEGSKLGVGTRVERPGAIQKCTRLEQQKAGQRGHCGGEAEKESHGGEATGTAWVGGARLDRRLTLKSRGWGTLRVGRVDHGIGKSLQGGGRKG
jgi:hypothetical protein